MPQGEIKIRLCKQCLPRQVPGPHHVVFKDGEQDLCTPHLYGLVNQLIELLERIQGVFKGT